MPKHSALQPYFEALERLKQGRPKVISKGSRINNDTVALEAGRGKGSIKKSRAIFAGLIKEIDLATKQQFSPVDELKQRLEKSRSKKEDYRERWEQSLSRELSLLNELYAVKKELIALRGGNVLPVRGRKKD